jgi:hypothetical protein
MKKIETTEDGWDCVPELMEVVHLIKDLESDLYEIEHCQRIGKLGEIVAWIKKDLTTALEWVNDIDTDREFVTVPDPD